MAGVLALAIVAVIPLGVLHLSRTPSPVASGTITYLHPGDEVTATGTIIEQGPDPQICFSMADSHPPQCSGPALVGDVPWDEIDHQEAGGVRWSEGAHHVQGTYDPDAGPEGTLTLTRPIGPAQTVEADDLDFPQLCDDPLRGADPDLVGIEAENALHGMLETFDVVDVWVSNGRDAFNVLVRGDAEQVHSSLRQVWGGPLCVDQVRGATAAERDLLVQEIFETLPTGLARSGSPSFRSGGIDLELLYLDEQTLDTITTLAGDIPVHMTTLLTPVGASSVVVVGAEPQS